jgi:hypothetical protein
LWIPDVDRSLEYRSLKYQEAVDKDERLLAKAKERLSKNRGLPKRTEDRARWGKVCLVSNTEYG